MGAMDQDILKVLYTEKEIAARVERMGKQMYEDLQDKNPLFVSVLRGAVTGYPPYTSGFNTPIYGKFRYFWQ